MQLIFSRFSCGFETVLSAKTEKNYVRNSDNFFLTKYGIQTNSNSNVFTHISYNFWLTQTYYTSFLSSEIVELMISLTESSSSYGFWATVQNISLIFFGSDFIFLMEKPRLVEFFAWNWQNYEYFSFWASEAPLYNKFQIMMNLFD